MQQKLNRFQFELIEKAPPYSRNQKKFDGYSGIYSAFEKQGPPEQTPSYIGFTEDLYRRCMLDHQKPSQPFAERLVKEHTGKNWNDFENYHEYQKMAALLLDRYEFRVIEECWEDGDSRESTLLQIFKPKYNKRHY